MNVFSMFKEIIQTEIEELQDAGILPVDLDISRAFVEPPREAAHGDLASNAAMVLANAAGMKPHDLRNY